MKSHEGRLRARAEAALDHVAYARARAQRLLGIARRAVSAEHRPRNTHPGRYDDLGRALLVYLGELELLHGEIVNAGPCIRGETPERVFIRCFAESRELYRGILGFIDNADPKEAKVIRRYVRSVTEAPGWITTNQE